MKRMRHTSSIIICLAIFLSLLSLNITFPEYAWAEGQAHYIAVGSDLQDTPEAMHSVLSGMPQDVEYVCLAGGVGAFADDGTASSYSTSAILTSVQDVFSHLDAKHVSIVYGSRDANATDDANIMKCADVSKLPSAAKADSPTISSGKSGLIFAGENNAYYIYGVSYYDLYDAQAAERAATEFKNWVDCIDPEIPIIVVGHLPIHSQLHDNEGASYWNSALNYAAVGDQSSDEDLDDEDEDLDDEDLDDEDEDFDDEDLDDEDEDLDDEDLDDEDEGFDDEDLDDEDEGFDDEDLDDNPLVSRDVIYLHGHNTSEQTEYFVQPYETLTVEGGSDETTVYYTYITAGYMKDNRTATLIKIDDKEIAFSKYTGSDDNEDTSTATEMGVLDRVSYYTITFDSNGGSYVEPQRVLGGTTAEYPDYPEKEGLYFGGWFTDPELNDEYGFEEVYSDMTLYARWLTKEEYDEYTDGYGGGAISAPPPIPSDPEKAAATPDTSDSSSLTLSLSLMVAALLALLSALLTRKRQDC